MSGEEDIRRPNNLVEMFSIVNNRISDIQKHIVGIRFIFLSIVAGFFTAINFIINMFQVTTHLSAIDPYFISLLMVCFFAYFVTCLLFFYELIYQEYLEAANSGAAQYELEINKDFKNLYTFNRINAPLASFRLNTIIIFIYSTFIFISFYLNYSICKLIKKEGPFLEFIELIEILCAERAGNYSDRQNDCINLYLNYSFSYYSKILADIIMFLNYSIILYFILFSSQRFIGKYLAFRGKYKEKYMVDRLSGYISKYITVLLSLYLIYIIAHIKSF